MAIKLVGNKILPIKIIADRHRFRHTKSQYYNEITEPRDFLGQRCLLEKRMYFMQCYILIQNCVSNEINSK